MQKKLFNQNMGKSEKKVYFAHCVLDYDTFDEIDLKMRIYNHFSPCVVVNPKDFKLKSMQEYLEFVKTCDILVYTKCRWKVVTCGVSSEIIIALENKIPVFQLTKDKTFEQITEPPTALSYEKTLEFMRDEL
jgi:hypothetical protein